MDSILVEKHYKLTPKILAEILTLESIIFDDPYSANAIEKGCNSRNQLIILLAYIEDNLCGYKIGHELNGHLLYSWLGGTHPKFRGKGVAKKLMDIQHQLAKEMGFKSVRTNTENKYRQMIILNLKSGFNIIGTYLNSKGNKITIILEKMLTTT